MKKPPHVEAVREISWLARRLRFGLGLLQAGNAVAVLPLAALLEKLYTLEALEDISLGTGGGI